MKFSDASQKGIQAVRKSLKAIRKNLSTLRKKAKALDEELELFIEAAVQNYRKTRRRREETLFVRDTKIAMPPPPSPSEGKGVVGQLKSLRQAVSLLMQAALTAYLDNSRQSGTLKKASSSNQTLSPEYEDLARRYEHHMQNVGDGSWLTPFQRPKDLNAYKKTLDTAKPMLDRVDRERAAANERYRRSFDGAGTRPPSRVSGMGSGSLSRNFGGVTGRTQTHAPAMNLGSRGTPAVGRTAPRHQQKLSV